MLSFDELNVNLISELSREADSFLVPFFFFFLRSTAQRTSNNMIHAFSFQTHPYCECRAATMSLLPHPGYHMLQPSPSYDDERNQIYPSSMGATDNQSAKSIQHMGGFATAGGGVFGR